MASFDVNYDVISEILSRSDLNMMRKCRILSKECNAITYTSNFMQSQKESTEIVCGYLIQSLSYGQFRSTFLDIDNPGVDDRKLSFDFLDAHYVEILATVDTGLVFCKSQHPQNHHYICKPTTRQWELIPSPNPDYFATKIAMIVLRSNPLCFKIVRLSDKVDDEFCDYIHQRIRCEIFESDSWTWKQSDDLMLSFYEYFNSDNAITACGELHWVTRIGNKYKVLSFHQDKESWESISVPDVCNEDNRFPIRLATYEGKLSILSSRRDIESVDVWIMKHRCGEKYWDRKYSIDLEGLKKEIGYWSRPVSFYDADTLLMSNDSTTIFYNFKKGRSHSLDIWRRHKYPTLVSFIQSDYQPVQLPKAVEDACAEDEEGRVNPRRAVKGAESS